MSLTESEEITISLIAIAINIANVVAIFTNLYSSLTGFIIASILLVFAYRKPLIKKLKNM